MTHDVKPQTLMTEKEEGTTVGCPNSETSKGNIKYHCRVYKCRATGKASLD
jgi:hypothetical protein